jgi:flagellar biosynthesis/type III secretory pathway chaperone
MQPGANEQKSAVRLGEIDVHRRQLLDEMLDMTQRMVRMLNEEDAEGLQAQAVAELVRHRGQVLWTLERLDKEAASLGLTDDAFHLAQERYRQQCIRVLETVMKMDQSQYPVIQKHMRVLRKQIQETQNAKKIEHAYQKGHLYNAEDGDLPMFLDIHK